jgi:hypothetical protein
MAYSDIALLAADNDFANRSAACASTQGISPPMEWANNHRWEMAGTPSFGDKYASAIANGIERPGNDPSVISDPDILSAVQSLVAHESGEIQPTR